VKNNAIDMPWEGAIEPMKNRAQSRSIAPPQQQDAVDGGLPGGELCTSRKILPNYCAAHKH